MRRAVLIALALAIATPSPAVADGVGVTETAGSRFPERTYAIDLPTARALTAEDVEVRENGKPVVGVRVTPAEGGAGRRFGVVLAIDVSDSMRGQPLDAAIGAARGFVRRRSPGQPIAVVTFAGTVNVVMPFSDDTAAIDRALSSIREGGRGTLLIDAAQRGVRLIRDAGLQSGAIVMVSDGADWHSRGTVANVAAAAAAANARVYTIGIASRSGNFGVPNLLAVATHGEFSAVDSLTDLARVYGRLGARLGHQYIVRYDSTAAPGHRVAVEIRVAGVRDAVTTAYRSPAIRRPVRPPFEHAPAERLWLSPATAVLLYLIVAVLVFMSLWLLLRPRRGSLRDRMASWVDPPEEGPEHASATITNRVLAGAERSLDGREWWQRFKEALDIARIAIPPVRLLAWVAIGTLAAAVLLPLLSGSPAFGPLALALPAVASWQIRRRVAKQRSLFVDQMPDNLQVVASAMRAGHSFAGALTVVVEDAPEPSRRELRRVIADERLGMPLDAALSNAVRRMSNKDLEQVALVATLQRESGGNTAEVLDRVTETVRDRLALRRMIASLTAQGRMSRWVLTAIPIFLLLLMTAINPTYMSPLYTTGIGRALLVGCAVMITAGSLVIKKIVDIKV